MQVEIACGTRADELGEPLFDRWPRSQMVEILSSARILRGAPSLDFGIFPVFQPLVVVGDSLANLPKQNRGAGAAVFLF